MRWLERSLEKRGRSRDHDGGRYRQVQEVSADRLVPSGTALFAPNMLLREKPHPSKRSSDGGTLTFELQA